MNRAQQIAGQTYTDSPKGISTKNPNNGGGGGDGIRGQRRRLSVVSDNKLIEGLQEMGVNEGGGNVAAVGHHTDKHAIDSYAGVSKKGYAPYNPRKKNQDSIVMFEPPSHPADIFLGTLDGHGEAGDGVSQFMVRNFQNEVAKHQDYTTNPANAITQTFASVEDRVLKDASIDTAFSGTTMVVGLIRNNMLYTANVGDSRLILGKEVNGNIVAHEVSIDHKPDAPEEKQRILAAGGRVFAVEYDDGIDGPARVWLGHMDVPGLAMSRSYGDSVAHSAGVTSIPEHFTVDLTTANFKYLVVATDGLWEFMDNDCVMEIVAKHGTNCAAAVKELVEEAHTRWMREEQVVDDTTVVVANVVCHTA